MLLNSRASSAAMRAKLAKKLRARTDKNTAWTTANGDFSALKWCKAQFSAPEILDSMIVELDVFLTDNLLNYDMIVEVH